MRRALLALCLLAGATGGCNSDSRQLLGQAEARWREGNYEDAIRLNTLLYNREKTGRYARQALLNIGNIYYLNLRKINDAIETYKKIVETFPRSEEELTARSQLAAIFANEIGDLTQAIAEYDQLLEVEDLANRQEILVRRANAYFSLGDIDRALRELRDVEDSGIRDELGDQVKLKIGNMYQMKKQYEDAAAYFEPVVGSHCGDCRRRALIHLSETYEALYRFDRAIATIQKLEPNPENQRLIDREVARLIEKQRRADVKPAPDWEQSPHR
jgi:tetratricopeptide (TPR) repeat protein